MILVTRHRVIRTVPLSRTTRAPEPAYGRECVFSYAELIEIAGMGNVPGGLKRYCDEAVDRMKKKQDRI